MNEESVNKGAARMFPETPAATVDMAVLPGVLGFRTLQRTVQVRLGYNALRLPGATTTFTVSRYQFMRYPGTRVYSRKWCQAQGVNE